jgi:hypothetical protein
MTEIIKEKLVWSAETQRSEVVEVFKNLTNPPKWMEEDWLVKSNNLFAVQFFRTKKEAIKFAERCTRSVFYKPTKKLK